jgi:hypothetical protein
VPVPPPGPAVLTQVVVRPAPLGRLGLTAGAVGAAMVTGLLLGAWLRGPARRPSDGRRSGP